MHICPLHCGVQRARDRAEQQRTASFFRDRSDKPGTCLVRVLPYNRRYAVAVDPREELETLIVWHCFPPQADGLQQLLNGLDRRLADVVTPFHP